MAYQQIAVVNHERTNQIREFAVERDKCIETVSLRSKCQFFILIAIHAF